MEFAEFTDEDRELKLAGQGEPDEAVEEEELDNDPTGDEGGEPEESEDVEGDAVQGDDSDEGDGTVMIPIPVYNPATGQEENQDYTYEEVVEAFNQAAVGKQYEEIARQAKPIMDRIAQSELLSNILYYKNQGYSEEQIKRGLYTLLGQELNSAAASHAVPDFETQEQLVNYLVEQKVQHALQPLQTNMDEVRRTADQSRIVAENDKVLTQALMKNAGFTRAEVDSLSIADQEVLARTLGSLYRDPRTGRGYGYNEIVLSQEQAYALVNEAFRNRAPATKKKQSAKNLLIQKKAPAITPGTVTAAKRVFEERTKGKTAYTDSQRGNAWSNALKPTK